VILWPQVTSPGFLFGDLQERSDDQRRNGLLILRSERPKYDATLKRGRPIQESRGNTEAIEETIEEKEVRTTKKIFVRRDKGRSEDLRRSTIRCPCRNWKLFAGRKTVHNVNMLID